MNTVERQEAAANTNPQARSSRSLRLLFMKGRLAWPRAAGHDVFCYHFMQALAEQGHAVSLATIDCPAPEAVQGLALERVELLDEPPAAEAGDSPPIGLSHMQERYRNYWGVKEDRVRAVGLVARACRADAVIVVGLDVLPYLGAVENALRIWYAGDEWAWHHLSQAQLLRPSTWDNYNQALVKGLYERAYGPLLDAVWVVSETDRRWMRWVTGARVDILPYGVNGEHFAPRERPQRPRSCAFWGRLDFGPNLQALEWFCGRVWPFVRRTHPDATFTIYGFQPTPRARVLASAPGISLVPNLPDLRDEIAAQEVVVLPFVSGGGIKNKLLEAAAMGKTIICTPHACTGLQGSLDGALRQARTPADWVRELSALWADADLRCRVGDGARRWVGANHTWRTMARSACERLESTRGQRRPA